MGLLPSSGFQGTVGSARLTNRVVSPIFKDLSAKRAQRVSVRGWAAPAVIGPTRGASAHPCGGSLHRVPVPCLQPACVWLSVAVSGRLCVDKLYLTPEEQCLSPPAVELENIDQVPRLVFLGKHFPEPTTMLHLI